MAISEGKLTRIPRETDRVSRIHSCKDVVRLLHREGEGTFATWCKQATRHWRALDVFTCMFCVTQLFALALSRVYAICKACLLSLAYIYLVDIYNISVSYVCIVVLYMICHTTWLPHFCIILLEQVRHSGFFFKIS